MEPGLAFRLVRVESRFDTRAKSTAGAVGLTQILPSTARLYEPGLTPRQLYDRDTNLRLGFRFRVVIVARCNFCRFGDRGGETGLLRAELAEGGENRDDPAARFSDDRVHPLVELRPELIADFRVDVVLAIVGAGDVAERQAIVL